MINFLKIIYSFFLPQSVHAHCDIPCGIYTTRQASVAAETAAKMVQTIQELRKTDKTEIDKNHELARLVAVKEEWAEICKRELFILWADYFKPEHLSKYPDLHDIFWIAVKLCSQNKREVNPAAAQQLRDLVDGKITQIFKEAEETKGEKPRV
ncbi:MAG: superoxide dismutase, Ni [Candidatus Wildermuthbacteria bacterium RIFCSPLOWO2_02_FULL_47_10]|nr:MAG: superoxide dismutase, Ni [Candidatus Wildermuthbacteria bacterium RIFCSPLOWO2_02_FULL_47_10]